jgi:hypothetical protein
VPRGRFEPAARPPVCRRSSHDVGPQYGRRNCAHARLLLTLLLVIYLFGIRSAPARHCCSCCAVEPQPCETQQEHISEVMEELRGEADERAV